MNQSPGSVVNKLGRYNFSSGDINRCSEAGFELQAILACVENLLENNLSTEERVRDTFFDEVFPQLLEDKATSYYKPTPASEFTDGKTEFLWYPYLPVGDYTLLMAPGGTGKTVLSCGIASAVSTGKPLPEENNITRTAQTVLIISAEDGGSIYKKRLQASGADLNAIYILDREESYGMNISSRFDDFKNTVEKNAPKLVILDPWHAFLGENINMNRVNVIRPVLQRLSNLAKQCDCSILLLSHIGKRSQGENINNAAIGSVDIVNASRSALYTIFDEDDEDGRILVHTKSNYAPYGPSIKYRIEGDALIWNGISSITRQTMEEAARRRKTPAEIDKEQAVKTAMNMNLVRAIMASVSDTELTRFTYKGFREKYGHNIFGLMQPTRAINAVSGLLSQNGYEVKAGFTVREGDSTGKGFSVSQNSSSR